MVHGASCSSLMSRDMVTKAVETIEVSRHENMRPERILMWGVISKKTDRYKKTKNLKKESYMAVRRTRRTGDLGPPRGRPPLSSKDPNRWFASAMSDSEWFGYESGILICYPKW